MNVTTLNMTTLDGNVVIKKGGGESGGGGNLSPDAIVYEPNGWYWKVTDAFRESIDLQGMVCTMFGLQGVILEVISDKGGIVITSEMKFAYRDIGEFIYMRNYTSNTESSIKYWKAFCESTHLKSYVEGELMEFNSLFDAVKYSQPTLTETDFETMVLTQFGLQRITKEEYEALITK